MASAKLNIHALRRAIHGLRKFMLCTQHIHVRKCEVDVCGTIDAIHACLGTSGNIYLHKECSHDLKL